LAGAGDTEQAAAEDKIHRAEIHALTLENALLAMDVEIAEAQEAERLAADQAQRKTTADDLERRAVLLEKAAAPIGKMLADLKEALDGCVPVVGEIGMPGLAGAFPARVAAPRARTSATIVAKPSLPQPFVPQIVEKPKPGPTTSIFALENLTWRTERGQQTVSAFHIEALPTDHAEIALKRGLAILPDSERYKEMQATAKKVGWPHLLDPMKMHDLDRDPKTVSVYRGGKKIGEEVPGPQFQEFDRGPARPASWMTPHIEPTPGRDDEQF
jgi:hypothetical protein